MILYSKVIVPAEFEPVTLANVKTHLKIDGSDEDSFILDKIKTATRMCENYSQRSFITQTRAIQLDQFPCGAIIVPFGPVQEIDSIDYASDGSVMTLTENTDFYVDKSSDLARIIAVNSWPTTDRRLNAVTVTYTAGFTGDDHDQVPGEIKEAVYKTVSRLYEKRGDDDTGPVLSSEITDILDQIKAYYNANV